MPRRRQGFSVFGAVGFVIRLCISVVIALTLYMGAEELGHRAAIALPGQSFEVAVPVLLFGTMVALLILPLFGGWGGGLRDLAAMTAVCLLAIALARGAGVLKTESLRLPMRFLGAVALPAAPLIASTVKPDRATRGSPV